ncbi:hypothetical protein [Methanosarcina sp.]
MKFALGAGYIIGMTTDAVNTVALAATATIDLEAGKIRVFIGLLK